MFTQDFIESLRNHKYNESSIKLYNPDNYNEETLSMFFKIILKSQSLDTKFYEEIKEIESCYYDPFETNDGIIKNVLCIKH